MWPNETTTTIATTVLPTTTPPNVTDVLTATMEVPNYEFDVYPVRAMCTDDEGGLGPEILGDALIVVAQVCSLY